MNTQSIGKRGVLFSFYDLGIPTNVYVIDGNKYTYIIDTYLGTAPMDSVKDYINTHFINKPIIVVNTHGHWDHIWGNCAFPSSHIIAHKKCKDFILKRGTEELSKYHDMVRGSAEILYPNLTFTDRMVFEEDDIVLFYSPGHTEDSISVMDGADKVLFAGDNLERPLPYLGYKALDRYVETLESYLALDCKYVIGGHTNCEDNELIHYNLHYLKKVQSGDTSEYVDGAFSETHEMNMKMLKSLE